jgi:hypothetical protein
MAATYTRPVFRIFDYGKSIEFYVNWLGFNVDWEDKPSDGPVYMQVSLGDIVIHLSEHYGDASPGARVLIEDFPGLEEYHKDLLGKHYKYMNPGLGKTPWNDKTRLMEVIDPFGNRLTFTGS